MTDVHTSRQRSYNMSCIRSRGNTSTELRIVSLLRAAGVTGWRRHLQVPGRPDLSFPGVKLAVFIDGCFWHACPKCRFVPASNSIYWTDKLAMNSKRDRKVNRELRKLGWHVLRIWEHVLRRQPDLALRRIQKAIG